MRHGGRLIPLVAVQTGGKCELPVRAQRLQTTASAQHRHKKQNWFMIHDYYYLLNLFINVSDVDCVLRNNSAKLSQMHTMFSK